MKALETSEREAEYHFPLSHHDTHLWAFQLHVLLSAGINLVPSLETLAKSDIASLSQVSEALTKRILSGMSLSQAMVAIRPAFSPLALNLITIGEHSGKLIPVLARLSDRAARRDQMERSLKSALAYPVFLSTVSLAMALFMAFYMFPKILPFLTGLGVALPWPTRALIWSVEHLSSAVLIITILLVAMLRLMSSSQNSPLSHFRDKILYQTPVIGSLNRNRVYSDCFSDLHLLLESGCDLVSSLKAIHSSWPDFNQRKSRCLDELRAGSNFTEAVEKSQLFPRVFLLQLTSAEETGHLPRTFGMIAKQLEELVTMKLTQLTQILEPCLFFVMGVITGFVVIATFLPMYGVVSSAL